MRQPMSFRSTLTGTFLLAAAVFFGLMAPGVRSEPKSSNDDATADNALQLVTQGRQIFRFDTFGDQAFWGDTLKLHQAIEGAGMGGIGPGVSPKMALTVGLKVDSDALPANVFQQLQHGSLAQSE